MSPPKIDALNHVAIEVTQLEPAIQFYRDTLGLHELPTPAAALEKGIRWFALPEGRMLHLIHSPQTAPSQRGHFALTVPDVQAWREYLKSHDTVEIPPTVAIYDAADRFYVRDPSGNMLEFVKWK